MKVRAIKTLNDNIKENKIYTLNITNNGIMLLFYTKKDYYIINTKIMENFIYL